jgi:thioredoxin 2
VAKQNKIIRCPACGQKNKIVIGKARGAIRCGKCKAELKLNPPGGRPVNVTDATFAAQVLQADKPVLVDFWAPWCGPCKVIGPVLQEMAKEHDARLKIAKINTEENQSIPGQHGIRSIPTLLLFNKGALVDRITGARPKEELEAWLRGHNVL